MGIRSLLLGSILGSLANVSLAAQQDPTGTWLGQWEREGSSVDVELVFASTASGYEGSFSSEELRVVGIPFSQIRHDAPTLSWELVGDVTTTVFEGTLQGNTLSGHFREGAATGTFRLVRATRTAAFDEEEISFTSGSVTLSGSVIYPMGPGPFPGVVFLHGSGPEGRWANRHLATAFARGGVAALVYDKRGVGGSTGSWQEAGFEDLVEDHTAAVEALRGRPRVAPDHVGVHGHSQGGTIAPWVATESPHIAFVVASAAGGIPTMAEMEVYSLSNHLGVFHMAEPDRRLAERYVRAIVATAFLGAPRSKLDAISQEVQDRPWAFPPPPESDPYWSFSRRIASYDPLAYWRRVDVPVLLVYGEVDERVPARTSGAGIAAAYLRSLGPRLDVEFFAGADHTFRLPHSDTGRFEWPKTVPGYPDRVIQWVLQVCKP